MNEAVGYNKGALCATMIGERLHPQRRGGHATTYDDVLLRTPVPYLGDDDKDQLLSGKSMSSRAFFSSSSFTTAHVKAPTTTTTTRKKKNKKNKVVFPKSGVRFINMMSRKLNCATLLIKWVLKLKKKERPDVYRIIKACGELFIVCIVCIVCIVFIVCILFILFIVCILSILSIVFIVCIVCIVFIYFPILLSRLKYM